MIQLKLGTNASGSQRIFYPFISRILVRQYRIARNSRVWHCLYVEVEEGTVRVHEEWYEKTMLLALDEGDTMTPAEREFMAEEGDKEESEQEEVSTGRSRRARKRVQDGNFLLI